MLPKQITDLLDGFVKAYDSEHPAVIEFRKARTQIRFPKGSMGWGSGDIVQIGKHVVDFLETKEKFIWEKMQQIISSTDAQFYPELNTDLKASLAAYFAPLCQSAEKFMEEVRQEAHAASGYTAHTKAAITNILPKINAEIDLFCASLAANPRPNRVISGPTIHNFTGIYGNVSNSHVAVCTYGSVHQLLVDRNIPKEERRELEDVLDNLKTASPDHKPSLMARAEGWVVKHKQTLGATAEIIGQIIEGSSRHTD